MCIVKFRKIFHYYFVYINICRVRLPLYVDRIIWLNFLGCNNLFILTISLSNFTSGFKFRIRIGFTDSIKLAFCYFNKVFNFGMPFIFQYLLINVSNTFHLVRIAILIFKDKQFWSSDISCLASMKIIMIHLIINIWSNLRIAQLLIFLKMIVNSYERISTVCQLYVQSIPVPYNL